MPDNEALQQKKEACLERCKDFGERNKQRWVKEVSPELLSHLYEALGERLALYAEHYRMPALIAYYNDLAKKHPNSQSVIDEIQRLGNPENEVARAERYIATFREKSEAQWQKLEDQLNEKRRAVNKPFDKEQAAIEASGYYRKPQTTLEGITKERAQLIQEKRTASLTEEELAGIRAKQIALSIREVQCHFKMRYEIVSTNGFSCGRLFPEEEKQIETEVSWSTEQDKLKRKIEKLESSVELLKQKVDYLSDVLERNANAIKKGKNSYVRPFSSIELLTGISSRSAHPDSRYRQNRTGVLEENNNRHRTVDVSILNQARDYVTNFLRKLVGVILIPLRAILGSCAPESLQKQAFYNTQSAHRLFKAKSDWGKYNERTEKEFGLPLRDLAL